MMTQAYSHSRCHRTSARIIAALAILALFSPQALAEDKLVEVMPDNMLVGLHIERVQRVIEPAMLLPTLAAAIESETDAQTLLEVIKKAPGPVVFGVLVPEDTENKGKSPDVVVAFDLTRPDADFHAYVEKALLPAMKVLADQPEDFAPTLDKSEQRGRVILKQGDKCLFAYAINKRRAVLSTKPQLPMRWARGDWPQRRWVQTPGVRKLLGKDPDQASIRVLFNSEAMTRMLERERKQNSETIMVNVFSEKDFCSVIGDLKIDKNAVHLRVLASLIKDCKTLARVLVRTPSTTRSLGAFPEEYVALMRIGWGSASDIADGAYEICDTFDETISREYREELAEFQEKTGVAWDRDILGNLVGELAFGLRVDFTQNPPIGWAIVLPLRDEATFKKAFDKLVEHFELTFTQREEDGLLLRTAVGTRTFSLTITGGHLLLGATPDALIPIARNLKRPKHDLPISKNLRKCYKELGESNHFAVMLDIAQLRQRFPMLPAVVGPQLGPAVMDGYAGFALTTENDRARADLLWSLTGADQARPAAGGETPVAGEAFAKLGVTLGKSLAAARRQARAVVVQHRLRELGQVAWVYASAHKGAFPKDLEDLVRNSENVITLEHLKNPHDGTGPSSISEVNTKSYLIYRSGLSTNSGPTEVLMAERKVYDGGACFLFVDGHVERIPEPRASELLQLIAEKADEIRK